MTLNNNQCAYGIPKHNCYEKTIWVNQGTTATFERCMLCGHIINFRYKSFWKRLHSLFFKGDIR